MAKICPVCGEKIKHKVKTQAGIICPLCAHLSPNHLMESLEILKSHWNENQSRAAKFQKSIVLKNFASDTVVIDQTNNLFFVGKEKADYHFYYSFDEIAAYHLEEVGGKVITKSKGGIGRAVVGGALFGGVGAIVGATTSKKETKTVGAMNVLEITLNTYSGKITIPITSPPNGLIPFLDSCIQ